MKLLSNLLLYGGNGASLPAKGGVNDAHSIHNNFWFLISSQKYLINLRMTEIKTSIVSDYSGISI